MNDMDMVVPGELLGARREMKAGTGAYEEGESVCSAVFGRKDKRSNYVNVASVNGFYMPNEGDQVIAIVTDVDQTIWVTDIRAPSPAILRTGEAPWKVEFGNTSHFLTVGDTAVVRIKSYDEIGRIQITMADKNLRKINSGYIIEIPTNKIAKLIGREGAMVNTIKKLTKCRIFVGRNGRVWIDGENEGICKAILAIRKVEEEGASIDDVEKVIG